MPVIDKPNVSSAAQVLGKQLVGDADKLTIAELKDQYAAFKGALATPELKHAMDQFLAGADPQLAGLLGADKAVQAFDARKAQDAVWERFFARPDTRKELFVQVFGAAKVAEVPPRWEHLMDARQEGAQDGKLVYQLSMSKPGPPDPRGFDVLITEGIASAKVAIDPRDMSWSKLP